MIIRFIAVLMVFFLLSCEPNKVPLFEQGGDKGDLSVVETKLEDNEDAVQKISGDESVVAVAIEASVPELADKIDESKSRVIPVRSEYKENIISENRWFFSIYDPKTGYAEYYDKFRNILGRRQKN